MPAFTANFGYFFFSLQSKGRENSAHNSRATRSHSEAPDFWSSANRSIESAGRSAAIPASSWWWKLRAIDVISRSRPVRRAADRLRLDATRENR